MIPFLLAGALAIASPSALAEPPRGDAVGDAAPEPAIEVAQVIFHSRVVIRVRTDTSQGPQSRPIRENWSEHKGPRCIPMGDIAGAAVLAPGSVDLVMRGGQRVRARFGASCPGLDYYSGFYIVPPGDAQICADRDVVRDRGGGECAIDKFRTLVPRK